MSLHKSDFELFMDQNTLTTATLTEEDRENLEVWAEHHAGGLYVLLGYLHDGRIIKMHDSWGDDDKVVIHIYNPDHDGHQDDPGESETYFHTGHVAGQVFLALVEGQG